MSRKAVTVAVAAATIAWSIGLAALVAPLATSAASSGDLIKASLPAVYYMGSDGKRYVFPNQGTYNTWYANFDAVQTITDAELAAIGIGGNVTYKPGERMVKITTDPKVYAVDAGGALRWVSSEAVATALYGSDWNTKIDDIPDAFFTNYTIGADITDAGSFSPAGVSSTATSINADKGLGEGSVAVGLNVSLASDNPAGGSVPLGAMGVPMLKATVSNSGSSAATVTSATIRRSGLGAAADFANVYLYSGAARLTTGRTINTSTNEATFSGLSVEVPAGGSASLWLAGDMAAGAIAGNENALELTSVMLGAESAGGTPLAGPTFNLTGATVGGITVARTGAQPLANVKAGELQAKVAEFSLTTATEDQDLNGITLFHGGNISRSNLTNLTLKQAGLTLATVEGLTSADLAVFELSSPMYIERGNTRTFEVYADIGGNSRSLDTVRFHLDQTSDISATGRTYGYGVTVTNTAYDNGANDGTDQSRATVEAGQLNLTFNGPAATDVARSGKDVELFNWSMTPQANLEVRTTTLALGGTITPANLTDVKITNTNTGAIIAGPMTGVASMVFTETYNLTSGETTTFKVTADVEITALDGDTAMLTLNGFGTTDVRNLDNSTYLGTADFVPSTNLAGNTHTVRVPSLTVASASTPVAQTYIMGSQGAEIAGITLAAGDASSINVSSLTLTGYTDTTVGGGGEVQGCLTGTPCTTNTIAGLVQTAKLWNGSTQVGDTESPTSSSGTGVGGTLVFNNLGLTVPAGQTLTLSLTGNVAGGLTLIGGAEDVRFDVAATSDVSATDPDGNSVAATGTTTGPVMTLASAGTLAVVLAPSDSESEAGNLVGGTSNAVLGKWKLTAINEELKLNKARFTTATPAGVSSMSLYDGSTLVGGPVAVDGSGNANFSGANFVIPKDASKTLTLKGDLNTVGAGGATTGNAVTTMLMDSGVGATSQTFEVRGTSAGSSTLIQTFGVANSAATGTVSLTNSGTELAGDVITINGVTLTEAGAGACDWVDGANATAAAAALVAAINGAGCQTLLLAAGADVTAVDNDPVVTINADVAGTAGNAITLTTTDAINATVSGATLAGGADGNLAGNAKVLRKSKPTVTPVALPSTTLSAGDQVVLRFTVQADAAGDVSFKKFIGNVVESSAGVFAVTAAATGATIKLVGGSFLAVSSVNYNGSTLLTVVLTNEEVVAAGTSKTYEVYATMTGAAANDSVSSKLQSDTSSATAAYATVAGSGSTNFVWSDMSIVNHSETTLDWTAGWSVKNLPTDSQTLVK